MTILEVKIFWGILGYAIIIQLVTIIAAYFDEVQNSDPDRKVDISNWTWGSGAIWFMFSCAILAPAEDYLIALTGSLGHIMLATAIIFMAIGAIAFSEFLTRFIIRLLSPNTKLAPISEDFLRGGAAES